MHLKRYVGDSAENELEGGKDRKVLGNSYTHPITSR